MIDAAEIYKVFLKYRGKSIVVPVGTSGRLWATYSDFEDRDLNLGGSLGHTVAAAFGLALALPKERVVCFDAEGSLLQNTGILATIAEKKPKNLFHFLMDNECYATTGGQPVPNAKNIDYAAVAKAMGYPHVFSFKDLESFTIKMGEIWKLEGPVFIAIKIIPRIENEPVTERKLKEGKKARRPMPSIKAFWKEMKLEG